MTAQSLTVDLPGPLYLRLKERAEQSQRSIQDEVLNVLVTAIPDNGDLPTELARALADLETFDDDRLWQAARDRLPPAAVQQMEALHWQRQQGTLSKAESDELKSLVNQYERTMLIRAQAACLLHHRGHDVNSLVAQP